MGIPFCEDFPGQSPFWSMDFQTGKAENGPQYQLPLHSNRAGISMGFGGWIMRRNAFVCRYLLLYGFACLFLFYPLRLLGQYFPETWTNLALGHGGRALAMGGAYTAVADGLASVSYNPAGLAKLSRPEFSLGVAIGGQSFKSKASSSADDFVGSQEYRIADKSFDFVGLAFPVKLGRRAIAIGLTYRHEFSFDASYSYSFESSSTFGTPVPYGRNDTVWDTDHDDHGGIEIYTLSMATPLLKDLYIGLSMNVWDGAVARHYWGRRDLIRYENGLETLRSTSIQTSDKRSNFRTTVSADLGLQWTSGFFSFGLTLRPKFKIPYSEEYREAYRSVDSDGWVSEYQDSGTVHRQAEWPWGVAVGASAKPTRSLTISCDFSTQKPPYDIDDNDNHSLRAGCEYRISTDKVTIPLRAGAFVKWGQHIYGNSQRKADPGFSLGAGLQRGDTAIDLVGFYLSWYQDSDDTIRKTSALGLSLTLTLALGVWD